MNTPAGNNTHTHGAGSWSQKRPPLLPFGKRFLAKIYGKVKRK